LLIRPHTLLGFAALTAIMKFLLLSLFICFSLVAAWSKEGGYCLP
jgi:hypothetical protein